MDEKQLNTFMCLHFINEIQMNYLCVYLYVDRFFLSSLYGNAHCTSTCAQQNGIKIVLIFE